MPGQLGHTAEAIARDGRQPIEMRHQRRHADRLVTHNIRDFEEGARPFGLRVCLPRHILKETET